MAKGTEWVSAQVSENLEPRLASNARGLFKTHVQVEQTRKDHSPFVITQDGGSEGFSLHGGPLTSTGDFNPYLQYRCVAGKPYNTLLAMSVQLSDHNAGDGGFGVVKGSHKLNFPMPSALAEGRCVQSLDTRWCE